MKISSNLISQLLKVKQADKFVNAINQKCIARQNCQTLDELIEELNMSIKESINYNHFNDLQGES